MRTRWSRHSLGERGLLGVAARATAEAPAGGGPAATKISLRWAVYDSRDGILDTTTLIDDWKWLATPGITVITSAIPK